MATALQLITRSMRSARVIGKGESMDDDEAADGLTALNAMLDSWQLERLFVYQIRSEDFTWTANNTSRTVGAAGNFVTDLPTRIDDTCTFTIGVNTYPVKIIDNDRWAAIPDKTSTSTAPQYIYPEYGAALVTLYAYPTPSANITFNMRSTKRLQNFTALTTQMALPPGNEDAIVFSLAERFGVEFGKTLLPAATLTAHRARANLKRINAPSPIMASDAGKMNLQWAGNVYSGSA